jgi:hypothetical protein
MVNMIMFWATLLSPIVGGIAIIVALVVARRSSRDAEKQIKAVYNLLDVFVAAQNPNVIAAKRQYERQLAQLDKQIEEAKGKLEIVNPFFGWGGAKIDDITYLEERREQKHQLDYLLHQRKELENQLKLIESYLNKVTK